MIRLTSILTVVAALCCSVGCQCCALTEPYQDLVDHVSDHEGNADRFYHPGFDLTRIGRADWPWRWCRRGPRIPVVVYETPATDYVFSREREQAEGVDPLRPPQAPGVAPYEGFDPELEAPPFPPEMDGPVLESPPEPPELTPPPPPAPMPTDPPMPAPAADEPEETTQRVVPPKDAPELMNRLGSDRHKQLANQWPSAPTEEFVIQPVDFDSPAETSTKPVADQADEVP
ncbi:hypothetical protein Mal4_55800 [Maioricimonas rarisocia]|uniref:Filamentous hemagglutinin n=1 Tax=Maioricimonas rarisocia TaxID=2528026 RepID=A0A517ZFF6_9PLAN|nr:hypothetical protein [Maioricimonas rarisocia]QDU41215.1 hypothetical protein Mal4_55800 [Maioricimonas rarisocia]